MRLVACRFSRALALLAAASCAALAPPVAAQDLPRVSVTRQLRVAGLTVEPGFEDALGFARTKFQGVIAAELASVGYRLLNESGRDRGEAATALTLVGAMKEEICDDEMPSQCRIAILWELQDPKGVAVYRTMTRAVDQQPSFEKLRRGLIDGALKSLLQRRRFALRLSDPEAASPTPQPAGPLGFKQCSRESLALPQAARAVAAALVWVESGSSLAGGAIVSGDGLVLTGAQGIEAGAPLRVRFSAEQTLPAEVVAINRSADVALLHVAAHTSVTCVPLRDTPLTANMAAFGVSSEPSEDRAISLNGSVVQSTQAAGEGGLLQVDQRVARVPGGPLLDEHGRLAGVVTVSRAQSAGSAHAVDVLTALHALNVQPAAITDPRLTDSLADAAETSGYVRDKDDPPFVLTKRYTYGTSPVAHRVRTAGLVVGGVGAFGVAATWLTFRSSANLSTTGYHRSVVLNDVSWVLLGLGAAGFGASYALPEGHDLVAVQSARRELFIGVGLAGLQLSGCL
jgi:S1-C subfamily serine protease